MSFVWIRMLITQTVIVVKTDSDHTKSVHMQVVLEKNNNKGHSCVCAKVMEKFFAAYMKVIVLWTKWIKIITVTYMNVRDIILSHHQVLILLLTWPHCIEGNEVRPFLATFFFFCSSAPERSQLAISTAGWQIYLPCVRQSHYPLYYSGAHEC